MQKKICCNCFRELKDESNICPHCGYQNGKNKADYPFALPEGTVLNGCYIVGRVLGQGGFGITYLAQDYKTKVLVAIKEYYPDTMAARLDTYTVSSYSGQRAESFQYGKECFLAEAKTLAEFIGNPNIVRVHCYFEENNTAYFVMDYVEGESLQKYLKNRGGKISWEEAKQILFPVMDALTAVHAKGIIHRDVSPDNIFITNDGSVKLLDFGAARYSLGDKSRSLDVVLKHGFAPKEQYTRHGRQGPYTDVYSLAATMYYAITFRLPPDSIDRFEEDDLILPSSLGVAISPEEEDVIAKALAVRSSDRYQNMAEFKQALMEAAVPKQLEDVVIEEVVPENDDPKEVIIEEAVQKDIVTDKKVVNQNVQKTLSGKWKWLIPAAGIGVMILALGLMGRNSLENTISDGSVVSVEEEMSESEKEMQMVSLAQKEAYYAEDGSLFYWHEYEYDGNGNEIKDVYYREGFVTGWMESEYDEAGNKIKQTEYLEDGSIDTWSESEYDNNGNEIKCTYYNEDGSIDTWSESEYDNNGNEIKCKYYGEDGSLRRWYEYEYDENVKKISAYRSGGSVEVNWEESEYDGNGNIIKKTRYAEDRSVLVSYEYEYVYNTEGYLVKKIEHGKGKVSVGTTVIEYSVMQVPVRKSK